MKKKVLSIFIMIFALCTCMFTLTACGEPPHTHAYDQQVVSEAFKASDATCEDRATYHYSCSCGAKGTETFENGEALGHSFTNYAYNNDAECEIDGTETAFCDHDCGEEDTRTKLNSATGHDFLKNICSVCGHSNLLFALNDTKDGYIVEGIGGYTENEIIIPSIYKDLPITSIGPYAFSNCSSFTSIEIPDSVTSIGPYAFFSCSSLTSIIIPDSVTSIGDAAFTSCYSLTSVEVGDNVTDIGFEAFANCHSLTRITLPFVGASKDGTTNTHFGYIFGASDYSSNATHVPTSLKEVIITGGSNIGVFVFYKCSSLTSIVIPDSATSIGSYAFYNCSSLETVYYTGVTEDWNNIFIHIGNTLLTSATRYYYIEKESELPDDDGNYWHYVDGVPTPWTKNEE